jgi:hypothetical protein
MESESDESEQELDNADEDVPEAVLPRLRLDNADDDEEEVPEAVLLRLRQNDPSETVVEILLRDFSDNELSEALQSNTFVVDVTVDLSGLANNATNWNSLLRILATREKLVKVCILDEDERGARNPPERVTPFLLAIQQNPSLKWLDLAYLDLSGDSMASFVDTATSIAILELSCCCMKALGGASAVAAALQCNTHI